MTVRRPVTQDDLQDLRDHMDRGFRDLSEALDRDRKVRMPEESCFISARCRIGLQAMPCLSAWSFRI